MRKKQANFLIFIWLLLLLLSESSSVFAQDFALKAEAALLMDTASGTILFEKNMHEPLYPASITKLMTVLLALEDIENGKVSLKDRVVVSEKAAEMGGSQIFLSAGDELELEDLIIGMLVGSGNDAAYATAEYLSGSLEAFVERMNERARELGMKNTSFRNPHGLHDEEHYMSAYDISILAREILKYPRVHEWATIWADEHFLQGQIRAGEVYLSNTNRLVRYYQGCDGLKTGFTSEAGNSICATAKRGDTRFLAIILGAPSSDIRYEEARMLLDYAFANYQSVPVVGAGEEIAVLPVEKGKSTAVDVVTSVHLSLLLDKGATTQIEKEIELPEKLLAPVGEGEPLGRLIVKQQGTELAEVDLIAAEGVPRASLKDILQRILSLWLRFGR
ncbi:MAG: D-alanyl-D-alanine carboxypeptidase family protein [Dethiobacteria bacterium]|nr:D-alanyl-D-alanine carboxypeptidase [Bacillota bacterium]